MSYIDEVIRHYGTPGMRWGLHKSSRQYTSSGKKVGKKPKHYDIDKIEKEAKVKLLDDTKNNYNKKARAVGFGSGLAGGLLGKNLSEVATSVVANSAAMTVLNTSPAAAGVILGLGAVGTIGAGIAGGVYGAKKGNKIGQKAYEDHTYVKEVRNKNRYK